MSMHGLITGGLVTRPTRLSTKEHGRGLPTRMLTSITRSGLGRMSLRNTISVLMEYTRRQAYILRPILILLLILLM